MKKLRRWQAFSELYPIDANWKLTAQLLNITANLNRKKGTRPFKVEDWLDIPRRERSEAQIRADVRAAARQDEARRPDNRTLERDSNSNPRCKSRDSRTEHHCQKYANLANANNRAIDRRRRSRASGTQSVRNTVKHETL